MGTLNLTEYRGTLPEAGGATPVPMEPAILMTPVAYSASGSSSAFQPQTKLIRIVAVSAFYYRIGSAPTSTSATGTLLPANTVEYVGVNPGDKIALADGT